MAHMQEELVRDRQRRMLEAAAGQRDGYRATIYGRISRQAERAERRHQSHRRQVARLRAELHQIETAS
jgi:hypothetical protein